MLDHNPGPSHAERPERLTAVMDALQDEGRLDLEHLEAPLVDSVDLLRVHPDRYLESIAAAAPASGLVQLDPDTFLSPGSLNAARRAAGAVTAAVRSVAAGGAQRAFCAVRPPGHHAEAETAMGFCLYSNVAIGARVAQASGLAKVAVVDFDVHHGNGTQSVFETDPSLFLASIHQRPLYPGTGAADETGVGNIVNGVVGPHAPRERWRKVFESLIDRLDDFEPDLVIISAGFDAHARDPLASQSLEAEDYAFATRAIVDVANRRAKGRVVSSLEGGYDLEALGRSAVAHLMALQEA